VKHASATEIVVKLCYPDTSDGVIYLTIRDNGCSGQAITTKPGHWGVRNMHERARAVGGCSNFVGSRMVARPLCSRFPRSRLRPSGKMWPNIVRNEMQRSNQRKIADVTGRVRQIGAYVRRSPGSQSMVYFGTAAVIVEAVAHMHDRTAPYALVREHLATLPLGAALTYTCVSLRPEDRARWNRVPLRQGRAQALQGVGLGAGAFLAWMGIAAAQGWASAPAWGWERSSASAVAQSVALLGVGHSRLHGTKRWSFAGMGSRRCEQRLGRKGRWQCLIPAFALYHGVDGQHLLGMLAGGTTLMLLPPP